MEAVPTKHRRRSIRLKGYDYAKTGAYFITVVTAAREALFGQIVDGEMIQNDWGQIVVDEWMKSATIRQELELDVFVVMPNHVHGILSISGADVEATSRSPLRPGPAQRSLGAFMAGFKAAVTKQINDVRRSPGSPCGSVTTMNTSSAGRMNYLACGNISSTTLCDGRKIGRIRRGRL